MHSQLFLLAAIFAVIAFVIVSRARAQALPTLNAAEVKARLDDTSTVILDVRSTAEFVAGHIPRAKNIPVQDLPNRLGEIDKSKRIIVYCRSGARSTMAQGILTRNGFTSVENFRGSWLEWSSLNYPVEQP